MKLLSPLYTVCDPFLNFFRGMLERGCPRDPSASSCLGPHRTPPHDCVRAVDPPSRLSSGTADWWGCVRVRTGEGVARAFLTSTGEPWSDPAAFSLAPLPCFPLCLFRAATGRGVCGCVSPVTHAGLTRPARAPSPLLSTYRRHPPGLWPRPVPHHWLYPPQRADVGHRRARR